MEKDCGVWNESMTDKEVRDRISYLFSGHEFYHDSFGFTCIGDYGDNDLFSVFQDYRPETDYLSLDELLCDDSCMQSYGARCEMIYQFCIPYLDHRNKAEALWLNEFELEIEKLKKLNADTSSTSPDEVSVGTKKKPRPSIRIVIRQSSSSESIDEPHDLSTNLSTRALKLMDAYRNALMPNR